MGKRHEDAWMIQDGGACNVIALCKALENAIREARDDGQDADTDPAVRLIVHQIAFLTCCGEIDRQIHVWGQLMDHCKIRAARLQITAGNACEYPKIDFCDCCQEKKAVRYNAEEDCYHCADCYTERGRDNEMSEVWRSPER